MRNFLRASILLIAPLVTANAQEKPIVYPTWDIDYFAPPATLEGLVDEADAVILGRVTGRHNEVAREERALPRTIYGVRLLEVLKPHPKLNASEVEIDRMGGDVERDGRIDRYAERGFPDFQQGRTYVLFLSWNEYIGRFAILRGPDSAFEINPQGRVETHGRFSAAKAQRGKHGDALLDSIRVHEKRQK